MMDLTSNFQGHRQPDETASAQNQSHRPYLNATESQFSLRKLRDTLVVLRTAIPCTDEDRALVEANVSYAQSKSKLLDLQVSLAQQLIHELQRRLYSTRGFERRNIGLFSGIRRLPEDILRCVHQYTDTLPILRATFTFLHPALPFMELAGVDISYAQSEDTLLDQEIARVVHGLEMLQNRQMTLYRFTELEKGILAPIRRLPVEILQHIFMLAHRGFILLTHSMDIPFPRVAAQVCSYWRSVSHSCAPLWATGIYDFTSLEKHHLNPMYRQLIEDCVRFSGEMSITFRFHDKVTPGFLGDNCVEALGQCAHRWKDVMIFNGELVKAVFASIQKHVSMDWLEKLCLYNVHGNLSIVAPKLRYLSIWGKHFPGDKDFICVTIESATSLATLTVYYVKYPLAAIDGHDWSTITEFTSHESCFQPDELIAILELMPNLVSFTFCGQTKTRKYVTVPRLEALTIGDRIILEANVFDILSAPRLKTLQIESYFELPWSSILQFVRRSGCSIEELKLKYRKMDAN